MKVSLTKLLGISVIFLFYLIPLQDLLVSFFFKLGAPLTLLRFFLLLKEGVVIFWGVIFLFRKQPSVFRISLLLFTIYATLFIFISDLPIYYTLIGFRTYLLILFSFTIGEHLSNTVNFNTLFLKHIKTIFLFLLVFSFLEYFILPTKIWIDLFPVIEMKKVVIGLFIPQFYDTGLPDNIMGELTRRMIGPFNEPLNMAYFTVILLDFFVALWFFGRSNSSITVVIGSIILFFTQTRAVIIGFILSILGLIFKKIKIRKRSLLLLSASLFFGVFILMLFPKWFMGLWSSIFTTEGRNVGHIAAYIDGIQHLLLQPWGRGVGISSNSVGFATTNLSTENAFINIGLELGIIGMLWILSTLVAMLLRFRRYLNNQSSQVTGYLIVVSAYLVLIQFIFAGFVAPHIMTARILIPFMILLGWASSIVRTREEIKVF